MISVSSASTVFSLVNLCSERGVTTVSLTGWLWYIWDSLWLSKSLHSCWFKTTDHSVCMWIAENTLWHTSWRYSWRSLGLSASASMPPKLSSLLNESSRMLRTLFTIVRVLQSCLSGVTSSLISMLFNAIVLVHANLHFRLRTHDRIFNSNLMILKLSLSWLISSNFSDLK